MGMASSTPFLFVFLLCLSFYGVNGGILDNTIKKIYSLGDSIADTGNLIREGASGSFELIAHLPYGETLGSPTGRCSDGLLMLDFLAQDLDLPLLKPYLANDTDYSTGVNFAVAGATALNVSELQQIGIFGAFTPSSLDAQLIWFKTHLNFNSSNSSSIAAVRDELNNALVLVGEIGGNDYNYAFYSNKTIDEVAQLIPSVIHKIVDAAEQVLDMGVQLLIIPGNFPIGCMPSYLTMMESSNPADYDKHNCLVRLNLFALEHNKKLLRATRRLQLKYPYAQISFADYFVAFGTLLKHAESLGFEMESLNKACCGTGGAYNFDASKICGTDGTTVCKNPAKYISWDGIHLTQHAYDLMSQELFFGGIIF